MNLLILCVAFRRRRLQNITFLRFKFSLRVKFLFLSVFVSVIFIIFIIFTNRRLMPKKNKKKEEKKVHFPLLFLSKCSVLLKKQER